MLFQKKSKIMEPHSIDKTDDVEQVSTWKKLFFYVIVSVGIILLLVGIFIGIIQLLLPHRAFFSLETVPWIYVFVYLASVFIVLGLFVFTFHFTKDNKKINRYFFRTNNTDEE